MQNSSGSSDLEICEWSESDGEWENCEWSEDDLPSETGNAASLLQECEWSSDSDCELSSNIRDEHVTVQHCAALPICADHTSGAIQRGTKAESPGIESILQHVRRSPRTPKPKKKPNFAFSGARQLSFVTDEDWKLSNVMLMRGCGERCTAKVHDLTEHDVLIAHSAFWSKTCAEQRQWLLDYFVNHCPNNPAGEKDPKSMPFLLCGRVVCQAVWLSVLSVSTTRFYEIRKEFMVGKSCIEVGSCRRSRSLSHKSLEGIAWMRSYFERVGDKRPDKDGIYLPTCLTEKAIFSVMVEELYGGDSSKSMSFSQFNKLFRSHFPNVTIPKVCTSDTSINSLTHCAKCSAITCRSMIRRLF